MSRNLENNEIWRMGDAMDEVGLQAKEYGRGGGRCGVRVGKSTSF